MVIPIQRDGVACHRLDGEAVLYDLAHHTLHYLNQTAAFIWERCDGKTNVSRLVEEAARAFGISAGSVAEKAELQTAVLGAVAELRANGVLDAATEVTGA
jgi:hypothetical protein